MPATHKRKSERCQSVLWGDLCQAEYGALRVRSGFRISNLRSLTVADVYQHGKIVDQVTVQRRQLKKKTDRHTVPLHPEVRTALQPWIGALYKMRKGCIDPATPIFCSRVRNEATGRRRAISRKQAWRIVKEAFGCNKLTGKLGMHAMRKTFANRMYERLNRDLVELQQGAEVHDWEVRLQPRQQPPFPAALSIVPARDAQAGVIGLRWLVRDITALRRAQDELERRVQERTAALQAEVAEHQRTEARLQAALQEKEMLLKDVHHRVKNNLQVIVSLLDLQVDTHPDPQLRTAVEDSQRRIQAMALIHESLYQEADLARVNAADYLR